MATAETARLIASLELQDKFSPGVSKITASVNQLERSTGGSTGAIGRMARGLQGLDRATGRTQRSLSQFSRNIERGVVIGAAATVAGIGAVVRAAADYETAFAGVRKTVQATEPQFAELSKGFKQLSTEIPISASALAGLGEQAGQLGIAREDVLAFTKTAALLGETTNLSADQAADALGRIGTILKLRAGDFEKFGSALVALGNDGATTESEIIEITKRFAASGSAAGLSTDQILAYSAAISSAGVEVEAAGTALSQTFSKLIRETALGSEKGKAFAKVTGKSFKEFAQIVKTDTNGALLLFLDSLRKMDKFEASRTLKAVGITGVREQDAIRKLAQTYTTNLIPALKLAGDSIKNNDAITKEAAERFKTFDSQVTTLKNTIQLVAISIGEKLLPKILPLVQRLKEFLNLPKTQGQISDFADKLASGFEKFAGAIQRVNWKPFIDGLKLSGEIAKTVIGAFRSLPEDLQKLVIAGFALNKVTGGLPTSIAKDIGASIIGNLAKDRFGKGGSPANPLFVLDVAGGKGGILPGGAGGKGLIGKATSLLSKVFIVGLAAEAASALSGPVVELGKNIHTSVFGENNPLSDFGKAWTNWQQNADWPFGQKNAPEWAGGKPANTTPSTGGPLGASLKSISEAISGLNGSGPLAGIDTMTNKLLAGLKDVTTGFKFAIGQLKENRDPKAIENAMKSGLALISKGRGNISDTKGLIAGFKAALKNVHDPKLRASLQAAINKVEARLPARSFAARQLAKADALIRDGKITNRDLKDLKSIERALKDRGLPHAASVIREKIATAQHAQVEASRWAGSQAASAIRAKRWQFTTNVTVNTEVSIKNQIRREHQLARVTASAS